MISGQGNNNKDTNNVSADNSIDLPLSPPNNLNPMTPPIHPDQDGQIEEEQNVVEIHSKPDQLN